MSETPPEQPDERTTAWSGQPVARDPSQSPWLGQVRTPPPERRPPIGAAVLAVALVVLIGAIAGFILFAGGGPAPVATATPPPVASSPRATATAPAAPSPAATTTPGTTTPPAATDPGGGSPAPSPTGPPTGTPTVGRTPPPDVAAQIDEVVQQIPPLRQLEPVREVPYVFLNRDEFQGELAEILEEEVDRDLLATEQRLLGRLGLVPDDADLYELLLQLYGSQIAAYYRPDTSSFYIIERDEPFAAMDRMIVAHEYTHALQDQHFDLEGTRITDPSEGDAALAQIAAVEGDATLVMFRWALESLDFEQLMELFGGLAPSPTDQQLLESMPDILRRQLEFPYNEGFLFTTEIESRGGWQAVDQTLSEPPASTEQILHPEKYLAGEAPIRPPVTDPLSDLGAGWERSYQQTMGELNMQVWLADGERPPMTLPGLPGPPTPWQEAAAGWGGDRLEMFEGPDGGWAIIWEMAWDSAADADEFAAAAEPLLDGLDGPALLLIGRGGRESYTLFIGSDQEVLRTISNPE